MRISIITPAWNAAGFIGRAIASVQAQSHADWELLIVDDASTDETCAVVQAAAAQDPRIKLLRAPKNGGPGAARNIAFPAAQGDFMALLDADDAYAPDRLARLLKLADRADIIADNLTLVNEADFDGVGENFLGLTANSPPFAMSLKAFLDGNHLFGGRRQSGYLKPMFRTQMVRRYGLAYREGLRIGEDFCLVAEGMAQGARYWIDPFQGYRYAVRAGSISRVMTAADANAMVAADLEFGRRFGASLQNDLGQAWRRRHASLRDGAAYLSMLEALKAGRPLRALSHAAARPAAVRHFSEPLVLRWRRLVQPGRGAKIAEPAA
jgi:succinoglycan biosynthesis protein ExoO